MIEHCQNLTADRSLGKQWERNFCVLAADYGFMFSPLQIGHNGSAVAYTRTDQKWNHFTLPDVTVWSYPGQHHEIKHKNPTRDGCFGLEVYRLNALVAFAEETRQHVLYTIHNHDLSGGRNGTENHIEHWWTVRVEDLVDTHRRQQRLTSWVNSQAQDGIEQRFWDAGLWMPLAAYWAELVPERDNVLVAAGGWSPDELDEDGNLRF